LRRGFSGKPENPRRRSVQQCSARPFKNREGKAQKNRKPDAYLQYARVCGFCGNAAIAEFSTAC
jgi:hypothetical protein